MTAPDGAGHDVNYLFDDYYRGKLRLNIYGHGAYLRKSGYIKIQSADGVYRGGEQFAGYLTEHHGIDFGQYSYIRVVACKSANGGVKSFAAKLSRVAQLPTKGFTGDVVTEDILGGIAYDLKNGVLHKTSPQINKELAKRSFNDPFSIFNIVKNDPQYPYQPVKFRYPAEEQR